MCNKLLLDYSYCVNSLLVYSKGDFMKKREEVAKELKVSRKTLYNYMQALDIRELTEENISRLRDYSQNKNKSKEISKDNLLKELEEMKLKNAELVKQNETLERGQEALLQQVEYYRNSLDSEIRQIKDSIQLLLPPPKEEKKSFFDRLFKR